MSTYQTFQVNQEIKADLTLLSRVPKVSVNFSIQRICLSFTKSFDNSLGTDSKNLCALNRLFMLCVFIAYS
jgi:hypothetical protein